MERRIRTAHLPRITWEGMRDRWQVEELGESPVLPPGSQNIEVWRNEHYKIEARITGTLTGLSRDLLPEQGEPGTVAPNYEVQGSSHHGGFGYELSHCLVSRASINSAETFEADLKTYRVRRIRKREAARAAWLTEWYLNSHDEGLLYPRSIDRELTEEYRVKREYPEEEVAFEGEQAGSFGRYAFVETPEVCFALEPIPEEFGPPWSKCLGIEYRDDWGGVPEEDVRDAVGDIVGFAMGRPLVGVGFTIFDERGYPTEQVAKSPLERDLEALCQQPEHPPVQLDRGRPTDAFEALLKELVPRYLELNGELSLDKGLWGYWLSDRLPLGANLPVLATSIEIIKNAWFRSTGSRTGGVYLPKGDFDRLLGDEFAAIEAKLSGVEYGDRILRRIHNSYNMGANESLEQFLDEIGLPVGEVERRAIRMRNLMAHGSSVVFDETEYERMIHDTLSYRTLFNRILLKILGYEGYYKDRSVRGWPERPLDEPMGGR